MTSAYWPPKGIPKLPRAIADAASDANLVIFVGAGVSIQMGCPSWEQFADSALKHLAEERLISIALMAAYLPARRASRVDPMIALRSD